MKCVLLQPSYIPWRGFFHQVFKADLFIFYDDAKYDKNGWRNRNQIKTAQGLKWLSIPVYKKGIETNRTPINEIEICWDQNWNNKHWQTIKMAYHDAPFFQQYADQLSELYKKKPQKLSDFTMMTTIALTKMLGNQHTKFMRSSELKNITGKKTDRIINILKAVNATHYISGPSAKDYIETDKFQEADIILEYMTYNYPEYTQLYPPYEAQVSILDLLFMTGEDAPKYFL